MTSVSNEMVVLAEDNCRSSSSESRGISCQRWEDWEIVPLNQVLKSSYIRWLRHSYSWLRQLIFNVNNYPFQRYYIESRQVGTRPPFRKKKHPPLNSVVASFLVYTQTRWENSYFARLLNGCSSDFKKQIVSHLWLFVPTCFSEHECSTSRITKGHFLIIKTWLFSWVFASNQQEKWGKCRKHSALPIQSLFAIKLKLMQFNA